MSIAALTYLLAMNCSWVIPEQIAIGQAWNAFTAEGELKDGKLPERFDRFAESLVENAQKLRR